MWVIVILLGLIGAGILVCVLWADYVDHPTRTSVDTYFYPTWRLPFPAVTLCNVNHIFRSKAEALVSKLALPKHITPAEAVERLSLLVQLISPNPDSKLPVSRKQLEEFQMILDNHQYTVRKLMRELGQSCDEMLERCMWEGSIHNCSDLFAERKSFDGFCCSFNYRGLVEFKMKNGSKKLLVPSSYKVRHTRYYGRQMGLTVMLQPAMHDYFSANRLSPGIRLIVHGPDDFPEDTAIQTSLPVGREIFMRASPTSGYCTEAVRNLSPSARECVFNSEKDLKYFPLYNENNCVAECRMDHTVHYCNCSHFYYHDTGKVRLCDMKDIPCLKHYFCNYNVGFASEAYDNCPKHHSESSLHSRRVNLPPCHCPPLCNKIIYSVDGTAGDFQAWKFHVTPFLTKQTNVTGRTLLHFYFSDNMSLRTRCHILQTWHQVVASFGGIFSLCLGCSFMSGIEILYYFTLHLLVHLRQGHISQSTPVQHHLSKATDSDRNVVRVVPIAARHFL